jgi:carboxy-terminal domain RNA polymerase II polypeptide A small phosphatase
MKFDSPLSYKLTLFIFALIFPLCFAIIGKHKQTPLAPAMVVSSSSTPVDASSFMTQTDAQGRSLTRAAAPVTAPSSSSSSNGYNDNSLTSPITTVTKQPRSRFLNWFCCFVGARPSDFDGEVDEYAHTPPDDTANDASASKRDQRSTTQSLKMPLQTVSNRSPSTNRLIRNTTKVVRGMPQRHPHIGPIEKKMIGKKCLVLDLDETLVHSSLREEPLAHMVIPVNIDNAIHDVYVIKRPGVDEFLKRMGEIYEVFIYTASLSKYADPLLDQLDTHKVISKRLFRENCVYHEGHYVKDLSLLNRDIKDTIIVDNSPMSYIFHPENAIDCGSFIDDVYKDIEMWLIGDFLQGISKCDDVREHCNGWREWCAAHPKQSTVPELLK